MKLKMECNLCGKEIYKYHAQIRKFFDKGEIPSKVIEEVMPL